MINDNATSHLSSIYDNQILQTIPYYESFHTETINLVKAAKRDVTVWLDTGCGTGSLVLKALGEFSNTHFLLSDPSKEMLDVAKNKLAGVSADRVSFLRPVATQDLNDLPIQPEVITAIQSHHYLTVKLREKAVRRCYDLLTDAGFFITFENISPCSEKGIAVGKNNWSNYQLSHGKKLEDVKKHMERFATEYFPITIEEHLQLLRSAGFKVVEILWVSYMQAGFYCIK